MRALAALIPALVGCTGVAPGPVALVMPAQGRSLAHFQVDDEFCRAFALDRLGGVSPEAAAITNLASSVIGAMGLFGLAGAVIDGSRGARIGAAVGAVTGGIGAGVAGLDARSPVQTRFDNAYVQCMFTRGHRVPISASLATGSGGTSSPAGSETPASSRLRVGVTQPW
jgi:hypothetical protein